MSARGVFDDNLPVGLIADEGRSEEPLAHILLDDHPDHPIQVRTAIPGDLVPESLGHHPVEALPDLQGQLLGVIQQTVTDGVKNLLQLFGFLRDHRSRSSEYAHGASQSLITAHVGSSLQVQVGLGRRSESAAQRVVC